MQANIQALKQHCKYCFQILLARLYKEKQPVFPTNLQNHKVPLFVTWHMDGDLRGCIGTFQPQNLSKILGRYALISALEDDRFDPISLQQLPRLSVSVSLLVNFTPNLGPFDWQVGKHGIILEITKNGRKYSATFLPEVASEQKWDKKTTLEHLKHKAGCKLPFELIEKDIKITTYESSKIEVTYDQWIKDRKQGPVI